MHQIKKLEFIEFLAKHNKSPTPNRLAAFDLVYEMDGCFSIKELQEELKKTGMKSTNVGVWYWCKLLSWAGVIKKIAIEDPIEGLVWRFVKTEKQIEEI